MIDHVYETGDSGQRCPLSSVSAEEDIADVIIDISHHSVDHPFSYHIPARLREWVRTGSCVRVPFGSGNRIRTGYVVHISDRSQCAVSQLKEIEGMDEEALTAPSLLIRTAVWMQETYGGTLNQCLKTVLPVRRKIRPREEKRIQLTCSRQRLEEETEAAARRHYQARYRLLTALAQSPEISSTVASQQLGVTAASWEPLEKNGIIRVISRPVIRGPRMRSGGMAGKIALNPEQRAAVEAFQKSDAAGRGETFLLHGITGSGKTEVYMEMMAQVLDSGRQVILLIPEISLTYQTVMRFYQRFGDRIAVINSRLSDGERFDQWMRAAKGEADVMIGPRSALFAPFHRLGLIIVDEEHEGAYQSGQTPRYHAVEAARFRASLSGASLVLGSATPSVSSYQKALGGEYHLLRLHQRAVPGAVPAHTEIIDLRKEMEEGNRSVFSRRLSELMREKLERKEQIMLFMNRRGYSDFVSCRSCGSSIRCPHCDVTLTLHGKSRLVCHYCGYEIRLPERCPSCGSPYLAGFGMGTQKLAAATKREFPEARILRMDADTTRKKGDYERILQAFAAREADILIGTQMIVKGHDFGRVTLVGIIAADLSLHTPDYRGSERTFQLLTQAAGRAGRAQLPGDVIIQTYQPEHYAIRCAADQDNDAFYREEMVFRRTANYPPACHMLTMVVYSPSERELDDMMERIGGQIRAMEEKAGLQIVGPAQAPVYRVNDIYRKNLFVKAKNYDILKRIRYFAEQEVNRSGRVNLQAQFELT